MKYLTIEYTTSNRLLIKQTTPHNFLIYRLDRRKHAGNVFLSKIYLLTFELIQVQTNPHKCQRKLTAVTQAEF